MHPPASVLLVALAGLAVALVHQTLAVRRLRRANARLAASDRHHRELAHTDPLTGLANRRGLLRVMRERAGAGCVLLAIDLDGFKSINDLRGHDVGDEVLAEVGRRLHGRLRSGDVAARLGGDEFAVLMWAPPVEAEPIARRLLDAVCRPYEPAEGGTVFLSASAGLADAASAKSAARLLRNADLALRAAKQRGKARIERYEPAYEVAVRRSTTVEHELRGAIDRGELRLAFQPVVALPSVRPVGAEALLRWHHPELGQVAPGEFIPIAERSGLMPRLGAWVLGRACHQLSRWLADGHDVWMSVNVSPGELRSGAYLDRVIGALRAHRVPAQRLVLEITEHDVAIGVDDLVERLGELRARGVRIALDDFGAGYSSLGRLHRLPVDILKIDKSLLAEPAPGPGLRPAPLVQVAVSLGQRLGLTVIAEGVAEVAHRRLLEQARCPYAQGVLFGSATPAEHVEAMLAAAVPAIPAAPVVRRVPPPPFQIVRPVDSGHEMRQS